MKKIKNFGQFNEHYNPQKTKLKEKMSYDDWYKKYANDVIDNYLIQSNSSNEPMKLSKEQTLKKAYVEYLNEI